jgi:uncharacterized protein (DUF779 family)
MPVDRVTATAAGLALIERLLAKHGPHLMFYQSGGCCDNSAPNCYIEGELTLNTTDVYLGSIGGVPFHMSGAQYGYWKHTQLIIDALDAPLGTDNFSLEGPEGKAFLTRSRLFSDEEFAQVQAEGVLTRPAEQGAVWRLGPPLRRA